MPPQRVATQTAQQSQSLLSVLPAPKPVCPSGPPVLSPRALTSIVGSHSFVPEPVIVVTPERALAAAMPVTTGVISSVPIADETSQAAGVWSRPSPPASQAASREASTNDVLVVEKEHIYLDGTSISELDTEVQILRRDAARMSSLLSDREAELLDCKVNLERCQASSDSQQEASSQMRVTIEAQERELAWREQEIFRRDAQLAEQSKKLEQLTRELSQRVEQPRRRCCRSWLP